MNNLAEQTSNFIMTWLDPIGVVIGLIMFIPVVWTWWEVTFGRKRRLRKWHREIRKQPGARPGILIIDLLPGKQIMAAVNNYRGQDDNLKRIPSNRLLSISRSKRITPADMPDLNRELRAKAAEVLTAGIDTLHCFYAGPATVSALVGAEFANSCQVILYQHSNGKYENFGPLKFME